MLDRLKKLWPFVLRIEKEIADNLAATLHKELRFAEAERDAADENAARGWKAADELAERLEDADADRVKAIGVAERLGKIAEEAIAERDEARERAAEFSRRLASVERKYALYRRQVERAANTVPS
jgi:hypothetical protein